MTLTIRLAIPYDAHSIHESHMRSIREICIQDHGRAEVLGWGYREFNPKLFETLKDNGNESEIWVAEYNHQVEWHGFIRRISHETSHICSLYITPTILNQGCGGTLLNRLLAKARDWNVKIISLQSTITAHAFYQHHGFVNTGPCSTTEVAGSKVRYYPMELELN